VVEVNLSSRRLLWGSGATIALIAAAQGCTALAFAVLTHRSSIGAFGAFAGVHAAAMALGAIADFGASPRRLRDIASAGEHVDLMPWLLTRALWHGLIAFGLAAIALPLTRSLLSPVTVVLLCSQVLTMNLAAGTTADVRALRSPLSAEGFVLVGNVLIVGSALAAPDSRVLEFTAAAATASWIVTALLAMAVLPRASRRFAMPSHRLNPWQGSFNFGLGSVAVAIGSFSVPVVALAAGSAEAAQLGAVSRWYQPITLLAAGTSAFLAPRFAAAATDTAAVRLLRSIRFHLMLGVVAALCLFLSAPFLVHELLADGYEKSVVLLRFYAVAALPVLLGQPLITLLNSRGHDRFVGRLFLVASAAGLAGTAAFAVALGATAAPVATMIVSTFLTIRFTLYTRQLVFRDRLAPALGSA
jgi:O-antigen/teichoic acid export membrane protein